MVSESNGGLYNTTVDGWHLLPPLRVNYSRHHRKIENTQDLKACIRAREFAWPGGYRLFFITADGGALSFKAVKDNFNSVIYSIRNDVNDGWKVTGLDNAEWCDEQPLFCDHTNEQLNEIME
jgi:hypothetical protein